ncbi:GntP family permease [Alteribacillus sp. YIM 98480]|uniref:GntP family permease n=1 Tax=Alteribacillus sp. YIM 98480 TaxID=2606599 RepID=UPI00131C18BC|nr:gluconate:H+ symporter [Alteribacillus sp. YIM 98480]
MVSGGALILIFILALASLFFLILFMKWEPFIALLVVAGLTGFVVGIPVAEVPAIIADGFGSTLAGVGILIGLGIMLGQLMEASGAIHKIAHTLLRLAGREKSRHAVAGTGLVVGIPLFFDAAFVILNGLIRKLSATAKVPYISLVLPLAMGLIIAYCLVVPTPAPLSVADNLGLDVGLLFVYGLIVAIPAIYVGGVLYGKFIGRSADPIVENASEEIATTNEETVTDGNHKEISTKLSFFVILLPIVLILLNTVFSLFLPNASITSFFAVTGEKNMALLISVIAAGFLLKPYFKRDINEVYSEAFKSCGLILLITGAGGAFGSVINESGIGEHLINTMQGWNLPVLILAFIFSQILRISLGSSTVALVTTASIIGPMAVELGGSPILIGLAIAAGGIGLSMPNDSGFWVVSKFAGLSVTETLKSWTIGGFIAGVTGLAAVYVLSLFSGILPGI